MNELEFTAGRLGRIFWSMVWRSGIASIALALVASFLVLLFKSLAISADGTDPAYADAEARLWYSIITLPFALYIWWRCLGAALKVRQPGFRVALVHDDPQADSSGQAQT